MTELSAKAGSEGYAACDDDGGLCCPKRPSTAFLDSLMSPCTGLIFLSGSAVWKLSARRLSPCALCARGRESQSHSPLFRRSALVGAM